VNLEIEKVENGYIVTEKQFLMKKHIYRTLKEVFDFLAIWFDEVNK